MKAFKCDVCGNFFVQTGNRPTPEDIHPDALYTYPPGKGTEIVMDSGDRIPLDLCLDCFADLCMWLQNMRKIRKE